MVAPDLVILDCDGVLVDSEMLACRVVSDCLRKLSIEMAEHEVLRRYLGISDSVMVEDLRERFGARIPPDFGRTLLDMTQRTFATDLRPVAGAEAMLRGLSGPFCVASSSEPTRIEQSLRVTGLLDYFGGNIFSATQVPRGKPAPDLFLLAASLMAVHPTDCVVVEDSMPGVTAAVAAGMRCIGFAGGGHCLPGHADQLRQIGAMAVLTDMRALTGSLQDLA